MPLRHAFVATLAAAMLVPAAALAAGNITEIHDEPFGDVDARSGVVEPSQAQLDTVRALGATATWSRLGSPATLIKRDGFLATGVSGATAAEAARNWLNASSGLFRAGSLDTLELDHATKLMGSDAYAVFFRQKFGSLLSAEDGYVTVGLTGSPGSWKVGFLSGSLTPDKTVADATLTPTAAWLRAAARVDSNATFADIVTGVKTDREWKVFAVRGMHQLQRARLRALPTPTGGVRPVWESLFVDVHNGETRGYSSLVDAVTGDVLVRHNLVEHLQQQAQAFTGTVPVTDGACDVPKGPYAVGPTDDVASIEVAVEASPLVDIVLKLFRDGTEIASADVLTNPEAIHYAPGGAVPVGAYTVVACEFSDGHDADPPTTYVGQIAFNTAAAGVPYPPKWKVFPAYPMPPLLGGYPWDNPSDDNRKTWCWDSSINGSPVTGCDYEVKNLASRTPWDVDARTQLPTFTTIGNNAQSAEAWANPPTVQFGNITPGPTNYRPTSATRTYSYAWGNTWFNSKCDPAGFTPGSGVDINASTANLFVMHNRMHDWAYHLGLTEENWNAQMSNFGNGAMEGDPVLGDVQSGGVAGAAPAYGGRDNANMLTLPDGVAPITNMYLWQPLRGAFYAPCVDGDYDQSVIGHEYGHMIENRLIGKGGTRSGHHAGAMGESHADLMAMEYLNEYGLAPVRDENRYSVGAYVTGQKQRGIRNYGMNASPLNFSDMGYDITGPQVHADGEIWSATQFDIRKALAEKHGDGSSDLQRECADGKRPADSCPGNRRWIQLVFDAYLLMPVGPSMLQARDAMLAADRLRFNGGNQAELWLAYAQRGFGENAASTNSNADTPTDPTPDFASPVHQNATVTFAPVAADESNAAVEKARLYVGKYEARVSVIADTDSATTGSPNLDATASFAPGTYEFLVVAPGYGHTRVTKTLAAGEAVTLNTALSTNWASASKGAVATGDGARLGELIDDTESTNWESATAPVAGKQVTVDLNGGTHAIDRVQVSALLKTGQNRFLALRQFELWTCAQTDAISCSDSANYTKQYTSPAEAFPGVAPRPVAPDLILRTFTLPQTLNVTHVRLVVRENQCTGKAAFQGVQDADPTNPTDCRTGKEVEQAPLLPPRDTTVIAAELQVFGPAAAAAPATPPAAPGATAPPAPESTSTSAPPAAPASPPPAAAPAPAAEQPAAAPAAPAPAAAPAPPAEQPAAAQPAAPAGGVAGAARTVRFLNVGGDGAIAGRVKGTRAWFRFRGATTRNQTVVFTDKAARVSFRSTRISSVRFASGTSTAVLTGVGLLNGRTVTFRVVAVDKGARGDKVTVRLGKSYARGGTVVAGGLTIRTA
jgi:hypothetical protein